MICFDAEYIYSLLFFKLPQKYAFCFYEMGNRIFDENSTVT